MQAIQAFSLSLITQHLSSSRFASPLLSYLAALALGRDGSWLRPSDYTPFLSQVLKCAQLILVADAYGPSRATARPITKEEHLGLQVRLWLANDKDTPLAELNLLRLYGREVARQGVGPGLVTWSRDLQTIAYKDKTLHLGGWRAMNQELLVTGWRSLVQSLLLGIPQPPLVRVSRLHDIMTESRPGYSLLDDPRNGLQEQPRWLWDQITA